LTLLEVLVQPLRKGQSELAELYRTILLSASGIEIVAITAEIADSAAVLRAQTNLNVPDAIQLAVAQRRDAVFLTNDRRLPTPSEISMLILDDIVGSP
jgi:predicted nucleic acid-binding protein